MPLWNSTTRPLSIWLSLTCIRSPKTVARAKVAAEDAVENIDIGGPNDGSLRREEP
ncbi:hypothetical protein KCP73_10600 [Salmonella enterica subsp. enterica]|nr:hypothetical protein KCP73_10600 [Salmonella enterica subsp. enterica]